MAGELETVVREIFANVDRKDSDAILSAMDEDVQGVDEISRRWLRGRDAVDEHWRVGLAAVADIRTELRDFSETTIGDVGIVTYWGEQDYTLEGNAQHVSAPMTTVLHRRGDVWKMVLFHSIPLPEDEAQ